MGALDRWGAGQFPHPVAQLTLNLITKTLLPHSEIDGGRTGWRDS